MQKTLIANRAMTYATRRLKAGDSFVASENDARILTKLGRASEQPAPIARAAQTTGFKVPPPPVVSPPAEPAVAPTAVTTPESEAGGDQPDPLQVARDEYEKVVGKRWFHAWDEAELRRRIAEHTGS